MDIAPPWLTRRGIIITKGSLLVAVLQMLNDTLLCTVDMAKEFFTAKGINEISYMVFSLGMWMQERRRVCEVSCLCMFEN